MLDELFTQERVSALVNRLHTGKTPADETRRQALLGHLTTASNLVHTYLGAAAWLAIPDAVLDHALVTVARDLETRDKSPGGVFAAFGEHDQGIRLARDPLTPVYPLLRPYTAGGFA